MVRRPGVDAVDLAEHEAHPGQRVLQRHADRARVDDPAGDLGQQWQVQEVVGRVDHDDVGRAAGAPQQPPGRLEPREAGPNDHDPHARALPARIC